MPKKREQKASSHGDNSYTTTNRRSFRAKYGITNLDIDAILDAIGEDPNLEEFSEAQVERMVEQKEKQDAVAEELKNQKIGRTAEQLEPLKHEVLADLQEGFEKVLDQAFEEFKPIARAMYDEYRLRYEQEQSWKGTLVKEGKSPRKIEPQTVDAVVVEVVEDKPNAYEPPKEGDSSSDIWD